MEDFLTKGVVAAFGFQDSIFRQDNLSDTERPRNLTQMKSTPAQELAATGLLGWMTRRCTLVAFVAFAALSMASPLLAQQEFALVGMWQRADANGAYTILFNPDGTYQSSWAVPPGANGSGSGMIQWRGVYRPTGESSWVSRMVAFQFCASGGGPVSCPPSPNDMPSPPGYACSLAKTFLGFTVGEQVKSGWEMSGSNQAVDQWGKTWYRRR